MSGSDAPVYLVAQLDVKDLEDFLQRYAIGVISQLQKLGAEVLAAAPPQILEGNSNINREPLQKYQRDIIS